MTDLTPELHRLIMATARTVYAMATKPLARVETTELGAALRAADDHNELATVAPDATSVITGAVRLVEQRHLSAEAICSCYRVPPYMAEIDIEVEKAYQRYYRQCVQLLDQMRTAKQAASEPVSDDPLHRAIRARGDGVPQ